MSMSTPVEARNFGISSYLAERAQNPSFVTVEIGHGQFPIAMRQEDFYSGDRAYFGIEADLRDKNGQARKDVEAFERQTAANVTFLPHDLGGRVERFKPDGERSMPWYVGDYRAKIDLADGIADEVFLGNVFGDNLVADLDRNTANLLQEVARLTKDTGRVILRETITPINLSYLGGRASRAAGLRVDGRIDFGTDDWVVLEALYGNDRPIDEAYQPEAYYALLSKN